jgi:hypothetical protein
MDNSQSKQTPIRIELTTEQREHIKTTSGEDVSTLQFTVEELEQRIAPKSQKGF